MDPRDLPLADEAHSSRPIVLSIDLNEIPSPPQVETPSAAPGRPLDVLTVVRRFHDNPPPFSGPPAAFPGDPGVGPAFPCVLCWRPETRGGTVICDGCERGFHLSCVGFQPGAVPAVQEWVCDLCEKNGRPSKRWPLGAVCAGQKLDGVRLLDINALPPSDGDGEGSEEMENSRYLFLVFLECGDCCVCMVVFTRVLDLCLEHWCGFSEIGSCSLIGFGVWSCFWFLKM